MRVTVCELPNEPGLLAGAWERLARHVRGAGGGGWVLLPEMPFAPWLAASRDASAEAWAEAVEAHERWLERLPELGAGVVAGTRPVLDGGRRFNEAFVWERGRGLRGAHRKTYLPDEEGFREATWYERGPVSFEPVEAGGVRAGFLVCTEMWFLRHAREYLARGVELLLVPRATPPSSTEKWVAGGRTAAVVSGAFCLSSNLSEGDALGGVGWIVHPEEGDEVGRTSPDTPFLTADVDLDDARRARSTYPRYVAE